MRVLSIDTASRSNTVALAEGDRLLGVQAWEGRDRSLREVVLKVDEVLRGAGLGLAEMDGFGTGIGPGSWTGVRVGLTVAKMFAYATGRPLCGVSSLETLACVGGRGTGLLCPVVEAGRGNVYAAFYRSGSGPVSREGDYYAGGMAGLMSLVSEPVLFLGEAAEDRRPEISSGLGSLAAFGRVDGKQIGSAVARIASLRLAQGESDDTLSLSPLYLGEPLARALLAGEG